MSSRTLRARIVRIARLVAHPISELCEQTVNLLPGFDIRNEFFERAPHTKQPRIAFPLTDFEAHMPLAQPGVSLFGGIKLRPPIHSQR